MDELRRNADNQPFRMKVTFALLICQFVASFLQRNYYELAIFRLSLPGASFIRYLPLIVAALVAILLPLGLRIRKMSLRVTFTVLVAVSSSLAMLILPRWIFDRWTIAIHEFEQHSMEGDMELGEVVDVPYVKIPSNDGILVIVSRENEPHVIEGLRLYFEYSP